MDWTDIKITVETRYTEAAAAILSMVNSGIYIEDYSDLEAEALAVAHIDLIDEDLLKRDRTKSILHIYVSPEENPLEYLEFIKERLNGEKIPCTFITNKVHEIDWANAWKKHYHPIKLSSKLAICPSWEEYTPVGEEKVITLDPGMAFGTGTHETTRLCLLQLEKYLKAGDSMLDVGTGSGILSICGKLLGAGHTVGVDIDELAVKTARENAKINNCDITFFKGDLATDIDESFDIICANIVADAIIALSDDIPKLLKAGGIYIVSGIIDIRKDEVLNKLYSLNLKVLTIGEENGWVAISLMKD